MTAHINPPQREPRRRTTLCGKGNPNLPARSKELLTRGNMIGLIVVALTGAVFSNIANSAAGEFIGPLVGAFGMTDPAGHSSCRTRPCMVNGKGDETVPLRDVRDVTAARSAGADS
ncbi:hypothetical protein [Streptomyces sp. NBC_00448]|uniref:hypothetical protein n=1 Tax=Streptomyces sp. NBC_00448 TaxID=2903652 RepID=UPI002E1D31DC